MIERTHFMHALFVLSGMFVTSWDQAFPLHFSKNWMVGRPGNKAICTLLLSLSSGKCCDEGKSFLAEVPDSPAAKAYHEIIESMACDRGL